jgi:hypothetical protein
VASQDSLEGIAQVVDHLEPIGDLDRPRRRAGGAVGVGATPITGEHLDARMRRGPRGRVVGRPIRQEVNRPPPLGIDQDRPVHLAAALAPVIHPQDARSG